MKWLTLGAITALLSVPALASAAPKEIGLNVHDDGALAMDVARDAHLTWVRVDFNWLDMEPTSGTYAFATLDAVVDAARLRGLSVLATVGYAPAWASSGDTKGDGTLNDVPLAGAYASFVTALVNHFKARITHYELWNEPNLTQFFEGTTSDYTSRVLVPGAAAVHAACATCKVVGPAVAAVGGLYDVWLDAALTAAKDQIDIVSAHDYSGFGTGPTSDDFFNKLEKHRVITVGTTVVYEGPLAYKEVMDKHGVTAPFWLTETGSQAPFADATAKAAQAAYYRNVIDAMLPRAWWTNVFAYEAIDNSGFTWGIVQANAGAATGYDPKPAFDVLKEAEDTHVLFGTGDAGPFAEGGVDGSSAAIDPDGGTGVDDGGGANGATSNAAGSSGGCAIAAVHEDVSPFGLAFAVTSLGLLLLRRRS